MRDTRIFKVYYEDLTVRFLNRIAVSGATAYSRNKGGGYRKGLVHKIEATNAEATAGWTDVTDEFLRGQA